MEKIKEYQKQLNTPVKLYFLGLVLAVIGLFLGKYTLLQNIIFATSTVLAGYHVIICEGIGETIEMTKENRWFTPNAHILMGLAAIAAGLIGNFWEGTLLILIFAGSSFLEEYAEGRSEREITKLIEMNPTTARLILADGSTKIIDVEEIKIGDKLQVLNGDQVPIDGDILSGSTSIDESAINGESIPKEKNIGDSVFASTINGSGTFTMVVTKESKDTVFSKILQLVNQNQDNQTKATGIIQKFEPKYVNFVIITVPIIILLGPSLFNWQWQESIYRGITLLVVASPCALAASTISATLSATSNLAKNGVLSKGSVYLSQLADIKAVAFDKTGTLTKGKPRVVNYQFDKEIDEEFIIDVVIALEKESNHPLANAILERFTAVNKYDVKVVNQIGQGLMGDLDGDNYRIGKPTSFTKVSTKYLDLSKTYESNGKTVVFVSKNEKVIGLISLMDVASENAKAMIDYLKSQNIHAALITGDAKLTGEAIGKELGIDEVIANVMPSDKSKIIDNLKNTHGLTAMVGDGINDAPALVNADVGIAMGDGTDVAVDVSDLVLMQNDLSKIINLHKVSKKMKRIIYQNIIFSMATVLFLVVVSFLGLTDIAVSVIVHEGSTIVVILNGLRLLRSI